MKLVRLTDNRYILDAGPDITMPEVEQIQIYFIDWWRRETEVPTLVIVGGIAHPLEYEDRREPDIEGRLAFLENHTHGPGNGIVHGPPIQGDWNAKDSDEEKQDRQR